jgi:hypothetical protein
MTAPLLFGLSGKKQSGKSTVAIYLKEKYNFLEVSWADPLKQIVGKKLLGLTEFQVNGPMEKKEAIDPFWGKSPRELLQIIGTDCFRDQVHPDFWVKIGMRKIQQHLEDGYSVVVTDCRFPNELSAIKNLAGHSVRISRPDQVNKDRHPSELALDSFEHDYNISAESGDIDGLKFQIKQVLEKVSALQDY